MNTKPKTEEEIEVLHHLAKIHKQVFKEIKKLAIAGVSAKIIDDLAENICKSHNVLPAFKGLYGFDASICVSINNVVAHGLPSENIVFKNGDVVSFDFGVKDKRTGLNTDAAFTMIIGDEQNPIHKELLKINENALMKGLSKAKTGGRIGDIGYEIEKYIVENSNFHLI